VGTGVSYTITYSPAAAGATSTASSSPVTISGLAASTTYTITVNAVVGGTTLQTASVSNVQTSPATAPTAVTSMTLNTISATSFSISWTGANGATSYSYYLNGNLTTPSTDNGLTSKTVTFSSLISGNRYCFYFKATNSVGSTWSVKAPTSISNCLVWLDAADKSTITANGSNQVTAWRDKTSNAFSFTGTANAGITSNNSYSATNNTNVISMNNSFTISNQLYSSGVTIPAADFTIIAHSKLATGGGRFISTPPDYLYFGSNGSTDVVFGVGNTSTGWATLPLWTPSNVNNYNVTVGTHTVSNKTLYAWFNGATTTASSSSTYTTSFGQVNGLTVCCGPQQNPNGNAEEIIIYTQALSTSDRQSMEGYLAWKYGTQASLASGHPHLSTPPTGMVAFNP